MRHQVIPPREAEGIDSMEKWILKNRTAAKIILISLVLLLFLAVPQAVHAEETDISGEILSEVRSRIGLALQAGEASVDLSDMDIIVNLYADRFGAQYEKILDLCRDCEEEDGSFVLGSHREPFVSISPATEPAEGCNEYGVGPNRLTSVSLLYDDYYRRDDGSADLELIAGVREQLAREYEAALSVVSEDMTDVEKALALYDYVLAVSNYPDAESIDENGIAVYDNESYSAVSVFRDHISVCVANATAYCYLLSDCGIPCIRVDSSEMEHSWTMLKVDGAWYHADPTWDDPRFEWGLTSAGDWNDDSWDLGAAGHLYFLKSDEEMTGRLGHYGWSLVKDYTEDRSVGGTPASGPSGSFDSVFFGDGNIWQEDVHYSYVNGSWYFLNRTTNRIVRTVYGQDMTAAEYLDAPSEEPMKYVYGSGDCLFICDAGGIWRYDTRDGRMEKLDLAENHPDEGEPVFTEMNIASGKLNGVAVCFDQPEGPVPVSFSYPVEELLQMKAVSGAEESGAAEKEAASEEETAEPAEASSPEEPAEEKKEPSPEGPAGEAAAPDKDRSVIWYVVLPAAAAAAVSAGILFHRRHSKEKTPPV